MSSIYYKNEKYTGPTLDLGSGSLTTDNKTIVGAINELNARVESGGEQYDRFCQIGDLLICYGRISESVAASSTSDITVTYAKSFSEAPTVLITPVVGSDYSVDSAYLKSRSVYSCVISLKNGYSGANTITVCWAAIGIRNA